MKTKQLAQMYIKITTEKTDEFLPMIFIAPELKEDLFKKPGSENLSQN
ncbi:hypothetical protein HYD66_00850 [Mycoplasmopsis bovis]|nr:hypothetical protein [Mycoplasmopsis bovis]QQH55016.1 hypothetical protein HYD66_00850 [Mycoplasmopsis bovis]